MHQVNHCMEREAFTILCHLKIFSLIFDFVIFLIISPYDDEIFPTPNFYNVLVIETYHIQSLMGIFCETSH